MKIFNSLTQKKEIFVHDTDSEVKMYNCGPTVYGVQHIGNLSMFVFTDIVKRTIESNGFKIKQVINITDVGHLSSDADVGEDKMTLGLKSEGKEITIENMKELASKFTDIFISDLKKLNIKTEEILFPRASDYIDQQININSNLEKKGVTYLLEQGLYFDTSKFTSYGELGNIRKSTDTRTRVSSDNKKNSADFVLWKKDEKLGWQSPWGLGFPGWHIECSAMAYSILGEQIDIHTGGIEHLDIHHNNEIAQSECFTEKKPFSKYWLHRSHLQINDLKISKSLGNVVYLSEIIEKGYDPISFRYHLLMSHYRKNSNFTYESLDSAQKALYELYDFVNNNPQSDGVVLDDYKDSFSLAINDDFNTPRAIAVVWNMVKDSKIKAADKTVTLFEFDKILGLNLKGNNFKPTHIQQFDFESLPEEVKDLILKRNESKKIKDWKDADEKRDQIKKLGYTIEDLDSGKFNIYKL